jgi:hypothetical protein
MKPIAGKASSTWAGKFINAGDRRQETGCRWQEAGKGTPKGWHYCSPVRKRRGMGSNPTFSTVYEERRTERRRDGGTGTTIHVAGDRRQETGDRMQEREPRRGGIIVALCVSAGEWGQTQHFQPFIKNGEMERRRDGGTERRRDGETEKWRTEGRRNGHLDTLLPPVVERCTEPVECVFARKIFWEDHRITMRKCTETRRQNPGTSIQFSRKRKGLSENHEYR